MRYNILKSYKSMERVWKALPFIRQTKKDNTGEIADCAFKKASNCVAMKSKKLMVETVKQIWYNFKVAN